MSSVDGNPWQSCTKKPDGNVASSWRAATINHSINHSPYLSRFVCRALLTKCWVVRYEPRPEPRGRIEPRKECCECVCVNFSIIWRKVARIDQCREKLARMTHVRGQAFVSVFWQVNKAKPIFSANPKWSSPQPAAFIRPPLHSDPSPHLVPVELRCDIAKPCGH